MSDESQGSRGMASVLASLGEVGMAFVQKASIRANHAPKAARHSLIETGQSVPTLSLKAQWRDQAALRERVEAWSSASGVEILWPETFARAPGDRDLTLAYDIATSPCVDFGKVVERVPGFWIRPKGEAQLIDAVLFLATHEIPFKTRGAGHSSGGQVLISHGAVIDMRGVAGIIEDNPEQETLRVAGGTSWLDVATYLRTQGRRPMVLTGHLLTTLGGTLSVGGFGGTSSRYGPQIASVLSMRLLTMDGTVHDVTSGDPLFDYTLAGRGQLGIIVDVTIKTMSRHRQVSGWVLSWPTMESYLADARRVIEERRFEYFIARYLWGREGSVFAGAGEFGDAQPDPASLEGLNATIVEDHRLDLGAMEFEDSTPDRGSDRYWPCLEFVLPLPDGIEMWHRMAKKIREPLHHLALDEGSHVMLLRRDDRFPLAPFPDSEYGLLTSVRPRIQGFQVSNMLEDMDALRGDILDAGGKIYMMSVEPSKRTLKLRQQFGTATFDRFQSLKREHDPMGLLNPGLFRSPLDDIA